MSVEQTLLTHIHRFDERALTEVYDLYNEELYRYSWRLLGDQDLAEECVSETYSRLLSAIKRGRGPQKHLRAYLYRTAHNWITDFYRRSPPVIPLDFELASDPEDDPSKLATDKLERQQLRSALVHLTPDQRQVVVLKHLEGWGNEDIARAMRKPVGAVKALNHRAVNALKRILTQEREV